jgi:hypothetical protein
VAQMETVCMEIFGGTTKCFQLPLRHHIVFRPGPLSHIESGSALVTSALQLDWGTWRLWPWGLGWRAVCRGRVSKRGHELVFSRCVGHTDKKATPDKTTSSQKSPPMPIKTSRHTALTRLSRKFNISALAIHPPPPSKRTIVLYTFS